MLRLIRWFFAIAIVAWLLALAVAFRIHGHTVAEVGCKLANSRTCETWAQRAGAQVHRALELFGYGDPPAAPQRSAEKRAPQEPNPPREARAPAPAGAAPAPNAGPGDGPPLDQHTPQDRRELDRILTNRGSR
jgi:hypothetical protein